MKLRGRAICALCSLALMVPAARAGDPAAGKQVFDTYATVGSYVYPLAGAMWKACGEFLDLCGYFGTAPDPVGAALKVINQRLDALEQRMDNVEQQLQAVQNELFRTQNLARVRQLRNLNRDLQSMLFTLAQKPTDKPTKLKLANDARLIANEFLTDTDLWKWSDLALKDHTWGDQTFHAGQVLAPDFKPMPTLEYYASALLGWMAAVDYAADGNARWVRDTYGTEFARHIAALSVRPGWSKYDQEAETLPEQIKKRITATFVPDKYPVHRVCTISELSQDGLAREIRFVGPLTYTTNTDDELCTVPAGLWNHATAREEELEAAYGTALMEQLAHKLSWLEDKGTVREQAPIWETTPIAPPGPAAYVTFLYALRPDGILLWYRHDGARDGAKAWQGPRKVASGWDQYTQILPGGGNILYGITRSGELHWYRHNGFNTGAAMGTRLTALPPESAPGLRFVADGPVRINPRDGVSGTARDHRIDPAIFGLGGTPAWDGPKVVGRGWGGFKQVFSGGDGIFYTVTQDGHLEWRRHLGYQSGGGMDTWEGPKTIAAGWGDYTKVFSIGNGVIYAINPAGQIWWAKHLGYLDGAATWQKMRNEPNQRAGTSDRARVGAEWNGYTQVFSAGVITPGAVAADKLGAVIYAVNPAGKLLWLNHPFYATGERAWLPAQEAGSGWDAFKQIVALIPTTTPVGGGVR